MSRRVWTAPTPLIQRRFAIQKRMPMTTSRPSVMRSTTLTKVSISSSSSLKWWAYKVKVSQDANLCTMCKLKTVMQVNKRTQTKIISNKRLFRYRYRSLCCLKHWITIHQRQVRHQLWEEEPDSKDMTKVNLSTFKKVNWVPVECFKIFKDQWGKISKFKLDKSILS